jgi:hypothetical protein
MTQENEGPFSGDLEGYVTATSGILRSLFLLFLLPILQSNLERKPVKLVASDQVGYLRQLIPIPVETLHTEDSA